MKRLLAIAALTVATLFASPTDAKRTVEQSRVKSTNIKLDRIPASVDVSTNDGIVTGMTAVKKDGSRMILKAQSKPTCATSCPAGKTLHCWEDEEQMMSICECGGGGSGDGSFDGTIASADFDF